MKVLSVDGLSKLISLMKEDFVESSSLSTVATSGSYNDLSNKPTIPVVDQTYNASSANAQSGVAIASAGFLKNTATGGDLAILGSTSSSQSIAIGTSCSVTGAWSLGIGYHAQATGTSVALGWYAKAGDSTKNNSGCIAIGRVTEATGNQSVAVGLESEASGNYSISLGTAAHARANYAYAIGYGAVNSQEKSLMFGFGDNSYILLDGTTGLIPDARISTNIARTSQIPSASDLLPSQTGNSGKFLTTNGTTASWATVSQPSIATTSVAGLVKPDGATVTITNDGTISASSSAITFRTWSV